MNCIVYICVTVCVYIKWVLWSSGSAQAESEKEDSLVGGLQFLIVMHQSKMLSFKGLYMVDAQSGTDACHTST